MFRSHSALFFAVFLVTAGCQAEIPAAPDCDKLYREIDSELKNSNYCSENADCAALPLGGKYIKFGCFHYVNKSIDKEAVYRKMSAYTLKCAGSINDCAWAPPASCVAGKCVGSKLCSTDEECRDLDCASLNTAVKSGYKPHCLGEKPHAVCKCMCYGCE